MKKTNINKKRVLLIIFYFIILFFFSILITISVVWFTTPLDTNSLALQNYGIKILDNNKTEISDKTNTTKNMTNIENLPEYVTNSFISIEDKNFYNHNGISIPRIIKSAFINIKNGAKVQGGSTISQQYIKNALLTNEKTYNRKIKEIILAMKLEDSYTKEQILEGYLNTIYFGEGCYGIEDASKRYFNKSASELTISESAILSATIKAPAIYSPFVNRNLNTKRKNIILERMVEQKLISKEEYEINYNDNPILSEVEYFSNNSYTTMAIMEACDILNISENNLLQSGYIIETYYNNEVQSKINIGSSDINKMQIISDKQTNGIIAYKAFSKYNLSNLKRQPASTIKPVLIYAPAVEEKIISPSTLIKDEPLNIDGYSPHNHNKKYIGYITARTALSSSLNIPAIKVLSYVGLDNIEEYAKKLDINLEQDDKNYSLALGSVSKGVHPKDILDWYSTLSNLGNYSKSTFIKNIYDKDKNIIYTHNKDEISVFSEETAYVISDMIKVTDNSPTTKKLKEISDNIYSKTGTASFEENDTDYYNVAYTDKLNIISWIGTDTNADIMPNNYTSSKSATTLTYNTLKNLNYEFEQLKKPKNVVTTKYSLKEFEINKKLVETDSNENSFEDISISDDNVKIFNSEIKLENITPIKQKTHKKKLWWYI